jgi:Lar family restriction alleviation protein
MPENTTANIKPCPFCGQTDTDVRIETIPVLDGTEDFKEVVIYQVCCEFCHAEGPSLMVRTTANHAESEAEVLEQWNRRRGQHKGSPPNLKNCPFCGEQPEVLRNDPQDADSEGTIAEVFCSDCGASGPANENDDLLELWNKRA